MQRKVSWMRVTEEKASEEITHTLKATPLTVLSS